MFNKLPSDVQEEIFRKLLIKERIIMKTIIKKSFSALKMKKDDEKKLGILHKAIKNKKITKLTPKIKRFLGTLCHPEDPTLKDIQNNFPGENITAIPVYDKIKNGTITEQDLSDLSYIEHDTQFNSALFESPPISFQILTKHPQFSSYLQRMSFTLFFNFFNYENKDMLEEIFNINQFGFEIDQLIDRMKKYILTDHSISMFKESGVQQLFLKYLAFIRRGIKNCV